jgi:FkbM family methyltransferase
MIRASLTCRQLARFYDFTGPLGGPATQLDGLWTIHNMLKEILQSVVWAQRHRAGKMPVREFEVIRRLLKPDAVAFDVGAHAGSWTVPLSRALPQGHVYAFEALPYYARALRGALKLLRVRNATVVNAAVMEQPRPLHLVWKDSAGHRLTGKTHVQGNSGPEGVSITVDGVSLDEFAATIPDANRIAFVKCDVEGFELSVLRGAVNLITRNRPIFWCELWAEYTARYNYTPNDIFRFFEEHGYGTYVVNLRNQLEGTNAAVYPNQGDILAAPRETRIS